ncbi:hypothetical protein [Nocardia beijingensis]
MLALYSAAIAIVTGATSAWIGYYFSVRKDRLQWDRSHATRWDSARREAYVAFAAAIKREVRLHVKMAAAQHPDVWPGHETLSMEEGWPLLAAAEDARADLLESILLLADGPTVEAAREWQQKVWELRVASRCERLCGDDPPGAGPGIGRAGPLLRLRSTGPRHSLRATGTAAIARHRR